MTDSHRLYHRRAFGLRAREPQLRFSPTAVFSLASSTSASPVTSVSSTKISSTSLSTSTSTIRTTSATSTSSSTSSSTTSSSTSTSTVASTTSASLVAPLTTKTNVVIKTILTTASSASASASTTSVAQTSGGISTGAVVGGVGAAIVAIVALLLAIGFFLRRSRKRDDVIEFDPQSFRRSAVILSDTPSREGTIARGFNPRPPSMIERRFASPVPTFNTQYGAPGPAHNRGNEYSDGYSGNRAGLGSHRQPHVPGQVMNVNYGPSSPNSIHPVFAPAIHNQTPISPVHTPIPPYKEQQPYYGQQDLAGQSSIVANVDGRLSQGGATYPVLTRQSSTQSSSDVAPQGESIPANDYIDLDRSSVSPFQAAQYVEISRRLNTEVPQGFKAPIIERDLPPLPTASGESSPFDDPESESPIPNAQFAIDHRHLSSSQRPESGGSVLSVGSHTLEFPLPPSPVHTVSSRYRIDSTPPTLPEINVESRVSVSRYSGLRNAAIVAAGHGVSGGLSVISQKFPTTPSPLASSFGIPLTPDVEATSFSAAASAGHPSLPPPESTPASDVTVEKRRSTAHSMYDAEDAYGGI